MLVHSLILLLWLVLMSLAPWARANDNDPFVARPPSGPSRAVRPALRPIARWDDEPVQHVAQDRSQNYSIFDEEPLPENRELVQEFPESLDLDAPAPAVSSGEWLNNGRWYAQMSVAYMSRSVSRKNEIRLARDVSSAALPRQQSALNIANQAFEPGMRSTIGKFLGRDEQNRDHAIEFTFLGLAHWHASGGLIAAVPGGIFNQLEFTNNVPAFDGANSQRYTDASRLNSFELNYRMSRRMYHDKTVYTRDSTWVRQSSPTVLPSIIAGLRVLTVDENFAYFSQATPPGAANGAYHVSTHNFRVGPQIGSDWFYERSEWRVGIRAKGGAFVNWASQSTQVQITNVNGGIFPSIQNRNQHASTNIMSFVGELSFIGMYQLRPNLALRTSYDFMWVTDLALAQNQVSFVVADPAFVSVHHPLFYQGVSLGLEYIY